ncbi:MAG: hypothetical protein H6734_22985 [Alphaproteobacteria bacterium]|nr:hypothetical protein [Alphaproteobacteria bacterium]
MLDLVRLGITRVADLAHHLQLAETFISSAAGHLISRGRLQHGLKGFSIVQQDDTPAVVDLQIEGGWAVWDPVRGHPLPELWTDERPPEPSGARLCRRSGRVDAPPSRRDVAESLTNLAARDDLAFLRWCGARIVVEGQPGVIRQIRPSPARWVAGSCWVPVAIRNQSTAVWMPSITPLSRIRTRLDPRGESALDDLPEDARDSLHCRELETRAERMPFLLKERGFSDYPELERYAERTTRRELGHALATCPDVLQRAIREAFVNEELHRVVDTDWRATCQGWADVLDTGTHVGVSHARTILRMATDCPSVEEIRRHRTLLDASGRLLEENLQAGWAELRKKVGRDSTTIGERVFALATACVLDAGIREAVANHGSLFRRLGRANANRNLVVHRRGEDRDVDPATFRADVLHCAAFFASLGTPTRTGGQ